MVDNYFHNLPLHQKILLQVKKQSKAMMVFIMRFSKKRRISVNTNRRFTQPQVARLGRVQGSML